MIPVGDSGPCRRPEKVLRELRARPTPGRRRRRCRRGPFPPTRGPAPPIGGLRHWRLRPPRTTPRLRALLRPPQPPRHPPARGAASSSRGVAPPCPACPGARCLSSPPTPRRPPALGTRPWPHRPTPPAPRSLLERAAPPPSASRVLRVGRTPPCNAEDGGRLAGGDVAPPGKGWCCRPPAGTGWTRPTGGKQRGGRRGRHGPAGGPSPPPGQLSRARTAGSGADGCPGAARRGGYVARARHRVASPGAATSGAARQPRSPSSVFTALWDLSRIVLS